MDEEEFLGRAVASGEGARVWFMTLGPQWASNRSTGCGGVEAREEHRKPSLGGRGICFYIQVERRRAARSAGGRRKGIAQVEPAGVKPWRRAPARAAVK